MSPRGDLATAKLLSLIAFCCAGIFLTGALSSLVSSENSPFAPGEKLSFRISWSNTVEAGNADLMVHNGNPGNKDEVRLVLKASTSPNLGGAYTFKDEFISDFNMQLWAPRSFQKNFTEKTRVVDEKVDFDQINRYAVVTRSKTLSQKIQIETGTQDPVSALYAIRSTALRAGMTLAFPVMDGGRTFQMEAKVNALELISTKLGNFNCHRLDIRLIPVSGSSNEKNIVVWFSNDQRRLPVLASIALPVGAAVIELTARTP
ncbi:MAG: DUF3108 domain-containing protein [Terriglobia bacterium]